jgi:hypothetical protein
MDEGRDKGGRLGILAGLALLALGLFWAMHERVGSPLQPSSVEVDGTTEDGGLAPDVTVLPVASHLSARMLDEEGPVEDELDAVAELLSFYRQDFGENPEGDNADLVAALLGENAKRAAYLTRDCPALVDGKLVDRWGTPYFFNATSKRVTEIVSAGPDRELSTGDDLHLP